VKNANDAGVESLRAAIDSAHDGVCLSIDFDLPLPAEIMLDSGYREITVPLTINGVHTDTVPAVSLETKRSYRCFFVNSYDFNINNMRFYGWREAMRINADDATVTDIVADSVDQAFRVNGDRNLLSGLVLTRPDNGSHARYYSVMVAGNDNVIGNVDAPNVIDGYDVAVHIGRGVHNSILYTSMYNNYFNPILLRTQSRANDLYSAPSDLRGFARESSKEAYIVGKAHAGDRIQVYYSSYRPGETRKFALEKVIETDDFRIDVPFDMLAKDENTYFTLTATSAEGSTSEISDPVALGIYPMECWVSNTKNEGEGSLRDAVDCANQAGMVNNIPARIRFDLDPDKRHAIILERKGLDIFSSYGVVVDPGELDVTIGGIDSIPYAFSWSKGNVEIANLKFDGWPLALKGVNNGAIIKGNYFGQNSLMDRKVFVELYGNGYSVVENNTFVCGDTALIVRDGVASVANNTFGDLVFNSGCGAYFDNATGSSLTNNTYFNMSALLPDVPVVTVEGGTLFTSKNNTFESGKPAKVAMSFVDANGVVCEGDTMRGYETGIVLRESVASISKDYFVDIKGGAIDVQSSGKVQMSQNLTQGMEEGKKIIDVHYGEANESNNGIKPPKIVYSTYSKGMLQINGKAKPRSRVEVFLSDKEGLDAIRFIGSATTDEHGAFRYTYKTYKYNLDRMSILATQTLAGATSEMSVAHFPFEMKCFVTSTEDTRDYGTLRYCINKANADSADIILFDISGKYELKDGKRVPAVKVITLDDSLPYIDVANLTIDGTSQLIDSDYPVIAIDGSNAFATALAGTSEGSLCFHGMEYRNFETPVRTDAVDFLEQTYSHYNGYTKQAVEMADASGTVKYFYKNVFESDKASVGQHITVNRATFEQNEFVAGIDTAVVIDAQDVLFENNTVSAPVQDAKCGIAFVNGQDSAIVSKNTINRYQTGVLIDGCTKSQFVGNTVNGEPDTLSGQGTALPELEHEPFGIVVQNSDSLVFASNTVQYVQKGVVAKHCDKLALDATKVLHALEVGIVVADCDSPRVFSSNVSYTDVGMRVESCDSALIQGNRIYYHNTAGLEIVADCDQTIVQSNIIGRQSATLQADTSYGVGILLHASNSIIGGHIYRTNYIVGNLQGGIIVDKGVKNQITYNAIYENDTASGKPAYKAIAHKDKGNYDWGKPTLKTYVEKEKNQVFEITGSGVAGDTIHLYRSDGYYQAAKYYIGKTVVGTSREWNITVDTSKFDEVDTMLRIRPLKYQNFTVVATATSSEGNTSELSDLMYMGTCYVNNAKDNSDDDYPLPGSLRQAAQCVNRVTEIGEIRFAVTSWLVDDIGLGKELTPLSNKHGIDIEARNIYTDHKFVVEDPNRITVTEEYINEDSSVTYVDSTHPPKLGALVTIEQGAGPVAISNLRLKNAEIALDMKSQSSLLLDSMVIGEVRKLGVKQLTYARDVAIANTIFTESLGARYLVYGGGSENISVTKCTFSSGTVALLSESSGGITFESNTVTGCDTALYALSSQNIVAKQNKIYPSDNGIGIYLQHGTGIVVGNTITQDPHYAEDLLHPLSVFQAGGIVLKNNTIRDQNGELAWLFQCNNIALEGNSFSGGEHSVLIDGCSGGIVRQNAASMAKESCFALKSSNNIKLSENLTKYHIGAKPIDLYLSDPTIKGNNGKEKPKNLGFEVKKIDGDCSMEEFRTGIFITGKAGNRDSVEVYFSDSAFLSLKKIIGKVRANDTGYWELRIPRALSLRNPHKWYHITATATDGSNNTSEAADMLSFAQPVPQLIVRNTNNDGSESLRAAVIKANCTDLFCQILFEIPTSGVPIELKEKLPPIESYFGVSILGGSQIAFAKKTNADADFATTPVIIDGSAIAKDLPMISQADSCSNLWIDSLLIKNKSNAIALGTGGAWLETLWFSGKTEGNDDNAIKITSSNNTIKGCHIVHYNHAVAVDGTVSENAILQNWFAWGNSLISVSGNCSKTSIKENFFGLSYVAIEIKDVESAMYIESNEFGDKLRPMHGEAIVLDNAKSTYILGNAFPYTNTASAPGSGLGAENAFVRIKNGSSEIMVSKNFFGLDNQGEQKPDKIDCRAVFAEGTADAKIRNLTITENQFGGLKQTPIVLDYAISATVTGNLIGCQSKNDVSDITKDYSGLKGVLPSGIIVNHTTAVVISRNTITNFAGMGIDLRNSNDIQMEYNRIFSSKSGIANKGIELHQGSDLTSNGSIVPPSFDRYDFVNTEQIILHGKSSYGAARIALYRGFEQKSQAFSFLADITPAENGDWSYTLKPEDFNYNIRNTYVAQITIGTQSSELSAPFVLNALVCDLDNRHVDIFDDIYRPCPKTDFTLDCMVEDVTYLWETDFKKMGPFYTQDAQLDTSATVTMSISDPFNCKHTETFVIDYKPAPQEPEFILASEPYVDDTIMLIDVADNQVGQSFWHSSEDVLIINTGTVKESKYDGKNYPSGRFVQFMVGEPG